MKVFIYKMPETRLIAVWFVPRDCEQKQQYHFARNAYGPDIVALFEVYIHPDYASSPSNYPLYLLN